LQINAVEATFHKAFHPVPIPYRRDQYHHPWRKAGVPHAALAEFERGLIIERTREGMKAARVRGIRAGRKPKLTRQQIEHAKRLIDEGQYRWQVAALFNVNGSTLYRALVA
jgi:hypothetical protein